MIHNEPCLSSSSFSLLKQVISIVALRLDSEATKLTIWYRSRSVFLSGMFTGFDIMVVFYKDCNIVHQFTVMKIGLIVMRNVKKIAKLKKNCNHKALGC